MTQFKHSQAEARKLWVEALKSGKYEQGPEYLRRGDWFCCLGVLCDLLNKYEPESALAVRMHDGSGTRPEGITIYGNESEAAPYMAMQWVGLRTCNGESKNREDALTRMNDKGVNFEDIANYIESAPPGLFVEAAS